MKKRKAGTKPSKKRNLGKFKSGIEKYCNDKFRYPNRYLKMTAKRKDLSDRSGSMQLPIRYTPDFVAKDESWVIETKGYLHSHHDFPMRWKLFLRHLVDNKMDCAVYIAKNKHQVDQVIADIKKLSDA